MSSSTMTDKMETAPSEKKPASSSYEGKAPKPDGREEDAEPEEPYSIFSIREKKFIVFMASLAALFSPLSANIYYPALDVLAADLNVSYALINLTITSYLIFQGIAPTFIGNISDEAGRRPSYLICFIIYVAANMGLALQNNYAALFVLRCLQSSGSSGTVALASAVVSDLVTSMERGKYIGYVSIGALVGPAFGPVIGGLLCQYLGWRSVFWFLTILAGIVLAIFVIVLPETCRKVVGNGSIRPQKWNLSVLTYLKLRRQEKAGLVDSQQQTLTHKRRPSPLNSIRILFDKESGPVLFYAATLFAGYYMIITGMPSQLQEKYGFNTLQIGLCYIPTGFGSLGAAIVMGRFVDWNFRRLAKKQGLEINKQKQQELKNFPIETARLQVVLPLVAVAGAAVIAYGWVMQYQTSLAEPLILLFVSTFCLSGAFNGLSTLIVDLNRGSPGAATAAMNLARCSMGAGAVAAVIPLLEKVGIGWTSVVVAGWWVVSSPIVFVVIKNGPRWREEKRAEQEKRQKEKEAMRQATVGIEEGRA